MTATTIRSLTRINVGLASNVFLKNNFLSFYRCLYSAKSLGLQGYENARLNFRNQFLNVETTFRSKMQEVCEQESSMIFTEDLKSMLHLAQKKPEDIELLIKMITKFNNQNKDIRFGSFVFGPVVMRTFYYLDEPDLALTAFKDPQFENFFEQLTSYQILLSLLYKHAKYAEMREVYEIIKNKTLSANSHPKNSLILVMAACYKENTPETFDYALKLWKELNDKGFEFSRKSITFLTALAIKQNAPHIALEIISTIRMARYVDIRCLKVAAYTNLRKFTEIVPILRMSLENDRLTAPKETYFQDVINKLEQTMAEDNIPEDFELYKLIALLKKNNYISPDTLNDHICVEIDIDPKYRRLQSSQLTNSNFPQQQRFRQSFTSRSVKQTMQPLQELL